MVLLLLLSYCVRREDSKCIEIKDSLVMVSNLEEINLIEKYREKRYSIPLNMLSYYHKGTSVMKE